MKPFKTYLDLDYIPKSLNVKLRSHWASQRRETRTWINIIAYHLDDKPSQPLSKVKISIVRHSYRTLDFDGLVGSMKPVIDALVRLGVIIDDSWAVTGAWDITQKFRPKSDGPRLEILLQEMPDKRN
jgi:hypothetical protein